MWLHNFCTIDFGLTSYQIEDSTTLHIPVQEADVYHTVLHHYACHILGRHREPSLPPTVLPSYDTVWCLAAPSRPVCSADRHRASLSSVYSLHHAPFTVVSMGFDAICCQGLVPDEHILSTYLFKGISTLSQ